MGSDRALYVPVSRVEELVELVPRGFDSVVLAPSCGYARAADPAWDVRRLGPLAAKISKRQHDAIVMAYSSVVDSFYFAHYRAKRLVRLLSYAEEWRVVRGTPEPWEAQLARPPRTGGDDVDFDAWSACDAVGEHYKLTGWFESVIEPTPKERAAKQQLDERVRAFMEQLAAQARGATNLADALRGAALGVPVEQRLIVHHREFFVLVDEQGSPDVRTSTCSRHGPERELVAYYTAASAAAHATRWDTPILRLRTSEPIDGGTLLATAARLEVNILRFESNGEEASIRLLRETLEECSASAT